MKQLFFLISLLLIIISCDKDEVSNDKPPSNASDYWFCKLDGKQYNLSIVSGLEKVETYLNIESSIAGLGMGTSLFKLSSGLYETDNNQSGFIITKGTMAIPQGGFPSSLQFADFMNDQNNEYSPDGLNGIEISYIDDLQEIWSTTLGVQNGSTFRFTKIEPMNILGEDFIITESEFNCALYNSKGNMKLLTSGKAKLTFQYQ